LYPDIFTFNDMWFSPFAVMVVFAFIFCLIVGYFDVERSGFRQLGFDEWDMIPPILLIFTGAVGARLLHAFLNWELYMQFPEIFFFPRFANVSSFGAIAAGFLTVYLWCLWRKRNFLIMLDMFAFYSGIGYGIIRIGCFLTGCCYGKVTDLPWGVVMQAVDNQPRHPVQLYASLGVLIFFFIMRWVRRKSPYPGFLMLSILGSYGILRFTTEFFRAEPEFWLGLSKAQFVAIGLMIFAAVNIYWSYSLFLFKKRKGLLPAEGPYGGGFNWSSTPVKEKKPEKKITDGEDKKDKPPTEAKKKNQTKKKSKKKKK